jgi:hypothetical protein
MLEGSGGGFSLIGKHLVWSVGNGRQVKIEEDPWVGLRDGYKFSEDMVNFMHNNIILSLSIASMETLDRVGKSEWKTASMLELEGENVDLWGDFVASLKSNFIFLK